MGSVVLIVGVLMMVVIHEAGHFIAAKAFDIKATEAFFGFGPRLWSMQRGETEYGIKALPLGGYVRIIGMNPLEEVDPADEGRTYREKPFWQKSIVVLAGIGSHFVIAFALFMAVILIWGRPGGPTTEIAGVSEILINPIEATNDDPLEVRGTDEIISIDGVPLAEGSPLWTKQPGALTQVTFLRDGVELTDTTTDQVVPTSAFLAGVQPGDVLIEFGGVTIDEWQTFVDVAHANPGGTLDVVLDRNGQRITTEATLSVRDFKGETIGFFGVGPGRETERVNLFEATSSSWGEMTYAVGASFEGLRGLVTNFGGIVSSAFGGDSIALDEARPISVIGLARIAGPVEQALVWLAFVNVFVGVLNVVPLYPLDGGHFAVALYEKIRGRHADVRKLLPVAAVVFVFILVIGLLGIYLDIVDPLQLPG